MKQLLNIGAIIIILTAINACEKSKDFIADNSDPTGTGYRPVSTNPLRDLTAAGAALDQRAYTGGESFTTELQFFSESPVKEIVFYTTIGTLGSRIMVDTPIAYKEAFSLVKRMDTLLITYTVPLFQKDTTIKLDFEIVNQNNLTLVRSATITALK
jgi:hypothetical protein